jgi:hypothetical protein
MTKSRIQTIKTQWSSTKQQPRRLEPRPTLQPCHWPDCPVPATSTIAGQVYCGTHFLQILHEHWKR